jgi:UDP:flavonoid glycosyltransferase YjiC (YdhE family)
VANGGFTALAEAAHLGKPVVSVPMRHQGEQELNAAWLEHNALGVNVRRPTVPRLRRALDEVTARRPRRVADGTAEACRTLDECLQEVA